MFKLNLWRIIAPSAIICSVAFYSMAQSPPPPEPAPNSKPHARAGRHKLHREIVQRTHGDDRAFQPDHHNRTKNAPGASQ